MDRQLIESGSPWEEPVGYSRAVRAGKQVFVSGTVGSDEDGTAVDPDSAYFQSIKALQRIEAALVEAGASLGDVVRTRIYVTDISNWELVGKAHGEFFGGIRPATTMVEVSRLISPDFLVEIEADAVIG